MEVTPKMGKAPNSSVIERFARALDENDFSTLSELLAETCVYDIRGKRHEGRRAIVDSYKQGNDLAHRIADSVNYSSEVIRQENDRYVVNFYDHLVIGDETLTHQSRQFLAINSDGLINSIADEEIPGEQDKLEAFLAKNGRTWRG